jgi:hypothetical protein
LSVHTQGDPPALHDVQVVYGLWLIAEVAIAATDLAEVIGSAVALNLLFHIPIWAGVIITAADVLFIIIFGTNSFRFLEVLIMCLCAVSNPPPSCSTSASLLGPEQHAEQSLCTWTAEGSTGLQGSSHGRPHGGREGW